MTSIPLEGPLEQLGEDWELHQDKEGNSYWWNNKTDETSWEKPQIYNTTNLHSITKLEMRETPTFDEGVPLPEYPKGSASRTQQNTSPKASRDPPPLKSKTSAMLPGTNLMENFLRAQKEAEDRKTDKSFGSHHFHLLSPAQQFRMAMKEKDKKESNITMSKSGFIYMDKRERLELERVRRLGFRREKKERIAREKREQKERNWNTWKEHVIEAKRTNALNAAWKHFRVIHPKVWELKELRVLRLLGNSLSELPRRLGDKLPNLTILSLSSNGILFLPESISHLTRLTDLNLNNNRLSVLPDSLAKITTLTNINVTNNYLTKLPQGIGAWKNIPRINLSRNELKIMPRTIKDMPVKIMLLNDNKFEHLQVSLMHTVHLTELCINKNGLLDLPQEISHLKNLRKLQACNNSIMDIPDSLYELPKLEKLWLDWNGISHISNEFRFLTSCVELKLEGNPMLLPPPELAVRGPNYVREWCRGNVRSLATKNKRAIIAALKGLFVTLLENMEDGSISPGLLRIIGQRLNSKEVGPGHEYFDAKGVPDEYYAFQFKQLESDYIPAFEALSPEKRRYRTWKQAFPYSQQQLRDALENYRDSSGTKPIIWGDGVDQNEKIYFKACLCHKPGDPTVRVPCFPPDDGYVCARTADLLKVNLATVESNLYRATKQEEEVRLKKELINVEVEVRARSFTPEYERKFTQMGKKMADDIFDAEAKQEYMKIEIKGIKKIFDKMEKSSKKERIKIEKRRDKCISKLEKKKEKLTAKLEGANDFEQELINQEIEEIDEELDSLPEYTELNDLKTEVKRKKIAFQEQQKSIESMWPGRDKVLYKVNSLSVRYKAIAHDKKEILRKKYIKREVKQREQDIKREYTILKKVAYGWKFAGVKMTFYRWKKFAIRRAALRINLAKLQLQREMMVREAKIAREKLIESETAKWEKRADPITDEIFYMHKETGEEAWEIPIRDFGVKGPGQK